MGNEFPFARRQAPACSASGSGVKRSRFFLRAMSPLRLLRARRELKRTLRDFRPTLMSTTERYGGCSLVLSSSVPVVIVPGNDANKTPSDGR